MTGEVLVGEALRVFFHMGGYAQYVWPAYGIVAVVLTLNVSQPWRQRRLLLKKIKHQQEQP